MCGIVGYLGPKDPKDVIVGGLKRLEYRGYDSAGVAIIDGAAGNPHIKVVRAQGKLSELAKKLETEKFTGHLGIGHTRWATHGVPSERNAHPHTVDGLSLVHNGIIENYQDIKRELASHGAVFQSDTDSELVAHLLARKVKDTKDLLKAVEAVLPMLRGAYAIVAMWEKQPDVLVAFKNGPPLVIGIGDKEVIVASDVQAIISHTNKVVYIDDHEIAFVKGADLKVFTTAGKALNKEIQTITWSADQVEKAGFKHFMLKEIHEQPRAVANACAPHLNLASKRVELKDVGITDEQFEKIERVFIVACGTSYYAAVAAKYMLEKVAKIPVETDIASEFRYRSPVLPPNTLVMTISQSGETADTLAALRMAKKMGSLTLSICNVRASSIDREADGRLYMNSGPEIGVASTKAFVSTLALLNILTIYLGGLRGQMSSGDQQAAVENLLALPAQMEAVLSYDKFFAQSAARLKNYRGVLFMGRGVSYPIALEGALKLKELAYMHAEGYAAGEMKHGPLALIDDRMLILMVCPSDEHYEKSLSNLEEARARGGKIVSIGTGDNAALKAVSDDYLSLPEASWMVNPILAALPVQLLAYHVADAMGNDVDQPRNLAKSVTVE